MKRIVFALAFIPLLLFSCGNDYSDKDRPDKAAIYYVKCAAEGHYDDYLKGMLSSEDASESYVRNMRTLIRQMVNENSSLGRCRDTSGFVYWAVCGRTS